MLADGDIYNSEFKIFDYITTILDFDEDDYLDNFFKIKSLKKFKFHQNILF